MSSDGGGGGDEARLTGRALGRGRVGDATAHPRHLVENIYKVASSAQCICMIVLKY